MIQPLGKLRGVSGRFDPVDQSSGDVAKFDEWVYLFKNSQVCDDFHSKHIQAAKAKLLVMHMNAAERKAYEQFLLSRANALDVMTGQFQEGVEQGIAQEKRENARKMKAKGLALALIAEISGRSEADLRAL